MRRLWALLMVAALLVIGCGHGHVSSRPTFHLTPIPPAQDPAAPPTLQRVSLERVSLVCASPDCGPYGLSMRWAGFPISFTPTGYYVTANGVQLADVTSPAYVVAGMDCGTTYTLGVQAHDGSGNTSQVYNTNYTTPSCGGAVSVPTNTASPSISGIPQVGSTQTASAGTWTGGGISFSYQWQQCTWLGNNCKDISGATSSTYTPSASDPLGTDAGHRLNVKITATNSAGSTMALPLVQTQAIAASSFRTFYISFTNGSDANSSTQAQSKSTPWKHAPGMVGCTSACSTYSATTGDHFVFEGGDTWPASVMPLTVPNSGTATASYYYGADPTWFIGASWSRPTFDAQSNTAVSTLFEDSGHSFIEVDNIHFTNLKWTGTPGFNGADMVDFVDGSGPGSLDTSITNSLLDNWSTTQTCSSPGNCDVGVMIAANNNTGELVQGNTCDQNSSLTFNYYAGACVFNGGGVYDHNTFFNAENAIEINSFSTVSNNTLFNIGTVNDGAGGIKGNDYDTGQHCNTIEVEDNPDFIYNNLVYNSGVGFYTTRQCSAFPLDWHSGGGVSWVYNNIVYNTYSNDSLVADCTGGGCGSAGVTSNIDNNTIIASTYDPNTSSWSTTSNGPTTWDTDCVRFVNRGTGANTYNTINEHNQQCTSGSTAPTSENLLDSGSSITNLTQDHILLEPTYGASGIINFGYTISNEFAPTTGSSATVDVGTNLTSSCTSGTDAQWMCWGIDGHPRPTGATAWDAGAYEWEP